MVNVNFWEWGDKVRVIVWSYNDNGGKKDKLEDKRINGENFGEWRGRKVVKVKKILCVL